jgi:hypothetical protein
MAKRIADSLLEFNIAGFEILWDKRTLETLPPLRQGLKHILRNWRKTIKERHLPI